MLGQDFSYDLVSFFFSDQCQLACTTPVTRALAVTTMRSSVVMWVSGFHRLLDCRVPGCTGMNVKCGMSPTRSRI